MEHDASDVTFNDRLVAWEELLSEVSVVFGARLIAVRLREIVDVF